MKNLSRLMDAAFPADHYPVRQKRQPRRLNPNWDGIRWLEEQSEADTEIHSEMGAGEYNPNSPTGCEFKIQRALGYYRAKRAGMYPRPMFQVLRPGAGSAPQLSYPDPCPACDDWSRTSRCTEHHDRDGVAGLAKGYERREARRAARGDNRPPAYATPPPGAGEALPLPQGLYVEALRQAEAVIRRYESSELEITGETLQPPATITIEVEQGRFGPRRSSHGFFINGA